MSLPNSSIEKRIINNKVFQWFALIAVGVGWGCTLPLSKLAVSNGNHPIGVTFWDTLITAVTLTVILFWFRWRLPLGGRYLFFFAICGFFGTAFPNVLSYTSYQHLSIGVNAIVLSLVPLATLVIALPFRVEVADRRRIIGLISGFVAILMIYLPETSLPDPGQIKWVALPVVVAFSYAIENVYIAGRRPSGLNALMIICGLSWAGLCFLTPLMIFSGSWVDISAMRPSELAIIAISFLHMVSYMGFVWLIERTEPVYTSQDGYIITAIGIILGIVFFDERHSVWVWSALVMIFIGLALVKPRDR